MSGYVIFKYTLDPYLLEIDSGMNLMLPRGSRPLYIAVQDGAIVLYAIADRKQARRSDPGGHEFWRVYMVGTGHPLEFDPDLYKSMGVAALEDGQLMFHVFISKKPSVP